MLLYANIRQDIENQYIGLKLDYHYIILYSNESFEKLGNKIQMFKEQPSFEI